LIVVLVLTIAIANVLRISSTTRTFGIEGLENKDESEKKEVGKEGADETLQYSEIKDEKKPDAKPAAASTNNKDDKSKSDIVDSIKKDAEKLIDTQDKIISGFEKIDPYMKQAEQLIEKIDSAAKQIETINQSKVEQYKTAK
jgi:hypothetical protein